MYAELPKGLTTQLMTFMEPYAAMATLRRRLNPASELDGQAAPAQTMLAEKVEIVGAPLARLTLALAAG